MKKNKLFEVINDIDERYIHEAGDETGDEIEESYAKATQPVGGSKIRFASIAKIAACIAVAGAVPAIIYSTGNPDISSPFQSGADVTIDEANDVTEEPSIITDDFSEGTQITDNYEYTLVTDNFSDGTQITEDNESAPVVDKTSEGLIAAESESDIPTTAEYADETGVVIYYYDDYAKEIEAAIAEWNDMEKTNPVDELAVDLDFQLSGAGSSSRAFVPTAEGTEVKAAADGEVVFAGAYCGENLEFARFILIKHSPCIYTSYMWLDENMNVMTGDEVTKGQVIGTTSHSPLDREGNGFDFGIWSDEPTRADHSIIVEVGKYAYSVYRERRQEDIISFRTKGLVTPVENVTDDFKFDFPVISEGGCSYAAIRAESGTEIRAVDDGEVVFAGFFADENYTEGQCIPYPFSDQNVIIIKHGIAVYTVYYEISDEILVKEGDTVTAGQVVGYSGNWYSHWGNSFAFGIEGVSDRMSVFHTQSEKEIMKMTAEKGKTVTKKVGNKIEFKGKFVDSADFYTNNHLICG